MESDETKMIREIIKEKLKVKVSIDQVFGYGSGVFEAEVTLLFENEEISRSKSGFNTN